jgi:iron-sulfur cluster protein
MLHGGDAGPYSFGDMAQDGVATVWNNDSYEAFRTHLNSPEPPEVCKSCAIYSGTF